MNHSFKIALIFTIISISVFAQDVKKEAQKNETKLDLFSEKRGSIIKVVDTNLRGLQGTSNETYETRIRKVITEGVTQYFYQIVMKEKFNNSIASIEYSDLLEIIKAINTLKVESEKDALYRSGYLENKFTTVDGFQVGYYVSKGEAVWFLGLEQLGSNNFLLPKDLENIENAFKQAKDKIEQLKR